jgi:arsenite methyltransferase
VETKRDCWAEWLAGNRTVEDPELRRKGLEMQATWRDRILDNAGLARGQTVLDVGCGEGLIAFGALERGAGAVVFSDISEDLLNLCRHAASELGLLDRCRFVCASANDLAPIGDATVDIVTTRSVLIYVAAKQAAFDEFARVLRPSGRVSLFEPINRFAQTTPEMWAGFDLSPVPEIARKIQAIYDAIQPPDSDPMLDFDERDLVTYAEKAGFHPIHLELEAEIRPSDRMKWETFASRAGNPRIPPIAEVLDEALTTAERDRLVEHLRPLVEEGRGTWRLALAYLHAVKP